MCCSPEHKRFVSADTLHGSIEDSTSLNRYSYVNGNPVSFVDPLGMEASRGGSSSFWDSILRFGSDFFRFGGDLLETIHVLIMGIELQGGYGAGLRGSLTLPGGFLDLSLGGKVDLLTAKINRNELDFGQEAILGAGIGIADFDPLSIEMGQAYYKSLITGKEIEYNLLDSDGSFQIIGAELYVIQGFNVSVSYNYIETYELLRDVWDYWI